MLPVSPGTATLTQGRHDVRARIMEQLDDVCVCVCVERGKRKEGKGGTRGLFGCACRRALCVCMQQVCMHEERLLK